MKSITSKYLMGNDGKNHGEIKNLSNMITIYWDRIIKENVIPKNGKRNWDLKKLLTEIEEMSQRRIMLKLYMQCINMGYTKFSELPKNNNYLTIFTACEKNEMLVKLSKIPTIDPKLKRAKGKANLNTTEELTSDYIANLIRKTQLEYNALSKELSDFNEKASLDIEEQPTALTV